VLTPPEQCDGAELGGKACTDVGYYGGTLACGASCLFDFSGCSGHCGDGVINGGEQCDGADVQGKTCSDYGFYASAGLTCSVACTFDTTMCGGGRCGDGVKNGVEQCDGMDVGSATCATLGFYTSPGLKCNDACSYDTSSCVGYCGDGIVDGPELCEGPITGQSCLDYGYDEGFLGCSGSCAPDFSDCRQVGWHLESAPSAGDLYAVGGSGPNDVFVVGTNGLVMHSDGAAFVTIPSGTTNGLAAVWSAGPGDALIVGTSTLLHWNGTTLTPITVPVGGYTAIWGADATDAFIVGSNGAILRYDGAGVTSMVSGTTSNLSAVWGTSATDVYAVGVSGTILHFNGTAWSPLSSGVSWALVGVWGSGSSDVWFVALNGVLHGRGRNHLDREQHDRCESRLGQQRHRRDLHWLRRRAPALGRRHVPAHELAHHRAAPRRLGKLERQRVRGRFGEHHHPLRRHGYRRASSRLVRHHGDLGLDA
jgi:hypothetical protein